MMHPHKTVLAAAVLAVFSAPAFAGGASYCVNCATLFEQITQESTFVGQLAKEAAELQEQIQMVTNQARNLVDLPQQLWGTVQGDVNQLIQIAAQAQGLSYASQNIVGEFRQTYGTNAGQIPPRYLATLQRWTQDTNSQIQSTLTQYHLDAGQFSTTQGALQGVEGASQSATGRMQVLQAANQISGLEVNELQQLRQETLAGNSAMLNYVAKRNNEDQLAFLEQLVPHYRHRGAMLIQDNASYHKDKEVYRWFSRQRHWLEVHQLPAYSPEFNPTEWLWQHTRKNGTHNCYFSNPAELTATLARVFAEMQSDPALIRPYLRPFF